MGQAPPDASDNIRSALNDVQALHDIFGDMPEEGGELTPFARYQLEVQAVRAELLKAQAFAQLARELRTLRVTIGGAGIKVNLRKR